jgi:hypothetical protein
MGLARKVPVLSVIAKATLNGVNRPNHFKGCRAFVSITSRLVYMKGVMGVLQGVGQICNCFIQRY